MSRKLTALLLAILMLPFSAMNVVAVGEPDLWINEINFSDDSPTGGDTVTIIAEVANDGGDSGVVSVTTNVTFYWDNNYIGTDMITIPGDNTADAEMDWETVGGTHTIKVIVDEENAIEESDEDNNEEEEDINVNYPPILFVDDDDSENNGGFSLETDPYYTNSLENISIGYDTIRVGSSEDGPDIDTLSEYTMIIWACGSDYASGDTDVTFTDNDKTNVADYLNDGGSMWVIGHDILYDFDYVDGERYEGDFEYDYFGISYVDHDRQTPPVTYGVDGDPISDGIAYDTDALSSDFADDIDPRDGFEKVLSSNGDYNISTIRTEEDYKLVFMAFDFSSITDTEDRDEFMENIVEYLAVQLENDVSLSRFNTPKNKETINVSFLLLGLSGVFLGFQGYRFREGRAFLLRMDGERIIVELEKLLIASKIEAREIQCIDAFSFGLWRPIGRLSLNSGEIEIKELWFSAYFYKTQISLRGEFPQEIIDDFTPDLV